MAFQLVQTVYWLALSVWLGAVLFIVVAAPVIFQTVRESNPLLPMVLSVNLDGQHGTLLAGSIVANILKKLVRIELVCAGGLLIATIGQWLLADRGGGQLVASLIRSVLYLGVVGTVLYNWLSLSPRIWKARQEYLDNADNPEVANPAKDQFDRAQQESISLMMVALAMLLGMVFFGAGAMPASHATTLVFSN